MSVDTDIRRLLLSKNAITSLVGMRVFPHHIPQSVNDYPCLTYFIVSNDSAHHLQGGAGYAASRLQIDVYAKTEASRQAVKEAVRNQLQGFPQDGRPAAIGGGTIVTSITYKNARDIYEPDQTGGDVGYYRCILDYWIRFQEAAPTFAI